MSANLVAMRNSHASKLTVPYYLVKLGIFEQGSYLHTRMKTPNEA